MPTVTVVPSAVRVGQWAVRITGVPGEPRLLDHGLNQEQAYKLRDRLREQYAIEAVTSHSV